MHYQDPIVWTNDNRRLQIHRNANEVGGEELVEYGSNANFVDDIVTR